MFFDDFTIKIKPMMILKVVVLSPVVALPVFLIGYILSLTEQPSNWVQAVGSVLALVGASLLPIWHFDRAKRQKDHEVLQLMSALAIREKEMFAMLLGCFAIDGDLEYANSYIRNGRVYEWEPMVLALNQFPLQDLPAARAADFITLRDAAQYALYMAYRVKDFSIFSDEERFKIQTLNAKSALVSLIAVRLPDPHDAVIISTVSR